MHKPEISFETERLYVRSAIDQDKDCYMALRRGTSAIRPAYDIIPGFSDAEWDSELNSEDDIYLSAFLKANDEFAASCSFQGFDSDEIEIGMDVVEKYRDQGLGTEIIKGLIKTAHSIFPGKKILGKTNVKNTSCQRVIEKCGGRFTEYEPAMISNFIQALQSMLQETDDVNNEDHQSRKEVMDGNAAIIENQKEYVGVYEFE